MTETPSIHHALAAVKKAVGAVKKAERNTVQGFNFRGVDAVVNAAAPHLNEHGVIVLPEVLDYSYDTVEIGSKRTPMAHVMTKVRYTFAGPAGDSLSAVVISESMDSGDKAVAKAMSVAYRIALLQVLNLPTDDKDPDADSFERSAPRNPQEFVTLAEKATTRDELTKIWKDAGNEGAIQSEIIHPKTGEKLTLQEYFAKRGDEVNLKSSPASPPANSRASKGGAK
jgi:ERF superfamily